MPAFKPKHSATMSHSDQPTEKEVLSKALINVAKQLDLNQKELSEILRVSTSETSRLFSKSSFISPNTNEGQCALLLIRIYSDLGSLLGDDENQIREWFKSYNRHLKGKPMELCKNLMGLTTTVKYLDAMRGLA